jgi:hypothetical protein
MVMLWIASPSIRTTFLEGYRQAAGSTPRSSTVALSITRNHLRVGQNTDWVIFGLTRRRDLRLYANRMTGSIPTEVANANAESLEALRVETNFLQGELVSEIGQVITWQIWMLGSTPSAETYLQPKHTFSRNIPSELGRLHLLLYLTMTKNSFSGTVPTEIGRLENLQNMTLSENLLSGNIPASTFGLLSSQSLGSETCTDWYGWVEYLQNSASCLSCRSWSFRNIILHGPFPRSWGNCPVSVSTRSSGSIVADSIDDCILTSYASTLPSPFTASFGIYDNALTGPIPKPSLDRWHIWLRFD